MAYVKIENGIVIQKQPNYEEGFVEAPEAVVCGFTYDGNSFNSPDIATVELTYAEKRAAEYPAIGDQLDAVLKGFVALADAGNALPTDLESIIADWEEVKTKYPKPQA